MKDQPNRREFLKGKTAAKSLADVVAPFVEDENAKTSSPDTPTVHITRRAMATEFELQFPDDPKENFTELALEAFEELEKVEEQLSYFRATSEIGRINLLADKQPVAVEPATFDLLELAMQLFRETGGAWDMTSTPLWKIWGFAKRKGRIPSPGEIEEAMKSVGSQYVELNAERKTVYFTRPGMKLNFGSLGKGYAIDRCASRLIAGGMTNFLLHGGQSSILAHTKKGSELFNSDTNKNNSSAPFFTIGVPHPLCPNHRLGEIRLRDRAIGTSNSRFQSFRHEGKLFGHILDPRTGVPAEGVLSTTVVAPSATLSDALSTAFYVLGPEKTLEYCKNHPEISVILLLPTTDKSGCEIVTVGLEDDEFHRF
jgi:thiamine biosynthesis lipoprotein